MYGALLGVMAAPFDFERNKRVMIPSGLAGAGTNALIREVYADLRDRLLAAPGGLLACVYGTPGCGKSVFASLLVLSLAEGGPMCIFYRAFNSPAASVTMCIRDGRVFAIPDHMIGAHLLRADEDDKPSWLVIDGTACPSFKPHKSLRVVVVFATSLLKNKWLRETDKSATLRLLMPPFAFSELQSLSRRPDLKDRFAVFGGSARLVCGREPHTDWARKQVRVLGSDVLRRVMSDVAEGSHTEAEGGNSRILHQIPSWELADDDPSRLLYDRCVVSYASPVVSASLVECFLEQSRSEVLRRLQQADVYADSFVVSLLFEPVMHYRLCHGMPFDAPEGKRTFRLRQTPMTVLEELYGAAHMCPDNAYLQPASKNYAAVDAVARCDGRLYLFQFTGQAGALWRACLPAPCPRRTSPCCGRSCYQHERYATRFRCPAVDAWRGALHSQRRSEDEEEGDWQPR